MPFAAQSDAAPHPIHLDALLDLLAAGRLVLVPHQRAAQSLRLAYDRRQLALGQTVWNPPPILAWTQWTTSLFADLILSGHEPRLLLNEAQEHHLWNEIVAADPEAANLGAADSLAELARTAFALASAWNAHPQLRRSATNRDNRLFADWAATFLDTCRSRQYLSLSLLHEALTQHLRNRALHPPAPLHLVNFPELTPSQQSLLEALDVAACTHQHLRLSTSASHPPLSTIAPSEREELTLAAHWLRRRLEAHPTHTAAVIVPNPADQRIHLEAAFREILAPELENIAADVSSTPWEFSAGPPLPTLTLIADALDLARWAHTALPLARISSLLLSPYLGQPEDRNLAAILDARVLRNPNTTLLRPELTLPSLLTLASTRKTPIPAWLTDLHALLASTDLIRPRTFADWAEFLRQLLASTNWPGDRALNPLDFEATRAFNSLLDLISTLDFAGRRVPFAAALNALQRQADATRFQPPSTHAPIQILTPAEAAGSLFDAAVFLRATDTSFPAAARPNPLLSWPLQQSLRMPGTDPALASAAALALTQSLIASTSTLLFTSAAEDTDGQLRPSPILAQLHIPQVPAAGLVPAPQEPAPIPIEAIEDTTPIPPLPTHEVRGGARVLQLQAACGFLAFAELRLLSSELESRTPGFNPRENGRFLHKTLQIFWSRLAAPGSELTTHEALKALPTERREQLLSAAIDEALPSRPLHDSPWDVAYLQLQKDRLHHLLLHWLTQELERGPFTILATERSELIPVGPLTLSVRMDRIDRVPSVDPETGDPREAFVFVDYKTGQRHSSKDWQGPRPDDPQLPLYALTTQPGELEAIVFAKVRAGKEARWLGYQATAGIFPDKLRKSIVPLDEIVDEWRFTLTQLAEDFAAGRASVSPKSFIGNCEHCAQRLLCRLDPATLLDQLDLDDDSTDAAGGGPDA